MPSYSEGMTTIYTIRLKRAYAPEEADDGARILVDGLWPRGMSKVREDLTEWDKLIAPDKQLRTDFHHGTISFEQFRQDYLRQLRADRQAADFAQHVAELLKTENVTLIYGSRDVDHNNAIVLKEFLEDVLTEKKKA